MDKMVLYAAAKLNLSLDICGRRSDGYHLMDMVMQSISLYDTVTIEKAESTTLRIRDTWGRCCPHIPVDARNTAVRAATLFLEETGLSGGVSIEIIKQIPSEAGMGGGSADAAAVLHGVMRLYNVALSTEKLQQIGLKVGADVPFCLTGGTARVQGIGEQVKPLSPFSFGSILVIKPPFGISTKEAFQRFDAVGAMVRPNQEKLIEAMQANDLVAMGAATANVLEQAADAEKIEIIKQKLLEQGAAFSLMTGSGSAVFGFFAEEEQANLAQKNLSDCGKGFVCRPVSNGVRILLK